MLKQTWKHMESLFEDFRRLSEHVDTTWYVAPGGLLRHGVHLGGGQLRRLPRRAVPRRPGHRAVTGRQKPM